MHLGILKTGGPPGDLALVAGSYPAMLRSALGEGYTYREFDIERGEFPDLKSRVEAYVITGSASGVHHGDPWTAQLREWLRALSPSTPLVGICFGHQIMAQAYGGVVEKSARGWTGGLQEYRVCAREAWMDEHERFVLPVAHEDQIVRLPAGAKVLASNELCPFALVSYENRRAVSFQGHPEFAPEYTALLIERYRLMGRIESEPARLAAVSLQRPHDCARAVAWIRRFLEVGRRDQGTRTAR